MNKIDWTTLLTPEQLARAKELVREEADNPRLRDLLIQEVLIPLPCPPGLRVMDGGFLKEYGGYLPPALGRLLLEYLTE